MKYILSSITKLLKSRVERDCVYGSLASHAQLVATHLWAKTRTQTARDPQIHQGCTDVWYTSGRPAQMHVSNYNIVLISYVFPLCLRDNVEHLICEAVCAQGVVGGCPFFRCCARFMGV